MAVFECIRSLFTVFFGTAKWYTKSCPNGSPQEPENHWKIDFVTSFSFGGASPRAGVEKMLATLRSELPRASIYSVLPRQNVTFRLFVLAITEWEITFLELPVGPPNAFIFSKSCKKKGLGTERKILENSIGKKS